MSEIIDLANKDTIVMMIQNGNIFIGKGDTEQVLSILEDSIQLLPVMTQNGPSFAGVLVGKTVFRNTKDIIVSIIDKKSSFYTQYYEVVSNIKIN